MLLGKELIWRGVAIRFGEVSWVFVHIDDIGIILTNKFSKFDFNKWDVRFYALQSHIPISHAL
jgi:hypothetical protein